MGHYLRVLWIYIHDYGPGLLDAGGLDGHRAFFVDAGHSPRYLLCGRSEMDQSAGIGEGLHGLDEFGSGAARGRGNGACL